MPIKPTPPPLWTNTLDLTAATIPPGSTLSLPPGAGGGSGTVTAVTGTAPIASSGGTSPDISLDPSGVSAASYGDATHVGTFTVDTHGLITAASSVAITGTLPGGTAGGDLSGTYPNPTVAKINTVALGSTTATAGNLLIGSGSAWATQAMSGDTTITSGGVVTAASTIQRTYYAGSTSGTSTYTATLSPVPTAYVIGSQYVVTVTSANTGAATMNFNSLGAKTLQLNGNALAAGQLVAGATYQLIYDGSNLQISGQASSTSFPAGTFGQEIFYNGTNTVKAQNPRSLLYGWADSDDLIAAPFSDGTNTFGAVNFSSKTLFATSGTGAGSSLTLEKGHPGTFQISAGITNNSGQARLYWAANASSGNVGIIYLDAGGGSDQVWYIKTDATLSSGTTRYQIGGGWQSNVLFNGGTERALWQYTDNVSSGVFRITVTSNNVAQTEAVGTTTVAASTWYRMRLNINAAYTAITLYISVGTVSGGVTTWGAEYQDAQYTGTMPRAAAGLGYLGSCFINKTVGTGNSAMVVDGWEAAVYLAAPRGG